DAAGRAGAARGRLDRRAEDHGLTVVDARGRAAARPLALECLVGAAEAASFCSGPSPAKAGGGWEGVPTVRADPKGTPPQPSPAFAGEGARSRLPPLLQKPGQGSLYSAACGAPMLPRLYIPERSKQQARRMPDASLSQAVSMRFTRV